MERLRIDGTRMARYTAREIIEIAVKGNVLIRGWGATYLLRSVPHVLCVRICAPMPFRTRMLMKRLGIAVPRRAPRDRAQRRSPQRRDAAAVRHRLNGAFALRHHSEHAAGAGRDIRLR